MRRINGFAFILAIISICFLSATYVAAQETRSFHKSSRIARASHLVGADVDFWSATTARRRLPALIRQEDRAALRYVYGGMMDSREFDEAHLRRAAAEETIFEQDFPRWSDRISIYQDSRPQNYRWFK